NWRRSAAEFWRHLPRAPRCAVGCSRLISSTCKRQACKGSDVRRHKSDVRRRREVGSRSALAFFQSVTAKIAIVPLTAFVLGLLIPGLLGYKLLQRGAERETHEKALALQRLLSAVPHYGDEKESGQAANAGRSGAALRREILRRYEAGRHEDSFLFRQ